MQGVLGNVELSLKFILTSFQRLIIAQTSHVRMVELANMEPIRLSANVTIDLLENVAKKVSIYSSWLQMFSNTAP